MLRAGTGSLQDMLRCVHIGLLCVQETAGSRPTMASVVLMLGTSTITLPIPSKPAYFMDPEISSAHANYSESEATLSVTELSRR